MPGSTGRDSTRTRPEPGSGAAQELCASVKPTGASQPSPRLDPSLVARDHSDPNRIERRVARRTPVCLSTTIPLALLAALALLATKQPAANEALPDPPQDNPSRTWLAVAWLTVASGQQLANRARDRTRLSARVAPASTRTGLSVRDQPATRTRLTFARGLLHQTAIGPAPIKGLSAPEWVARFASRAVAARRVPLGG